MSAHKNKRSIKDLIIIILLNTILFNVLLLNFQILFFILHLLFIFLIIKFDKDLIFFIGLGLGINQIILIYLFDIYWPAIIILPLIYFIFFKLYNEGINGITNNSHH